MNDEGQSRLILQKASDFFERGKITSIKRAGGHANRNYFVTTSAGQYVFKMIDEHPPEHAIVEAQYLDVLQGNGILVAPFIRSSGRLVFQDAGHSVVAFPRISGEHPRISLSICEDIGQHLAEIHSIPVNAHLPRSKNWLRESYVPEAVALVLKHLPDYSDRVTAAYDSFRTFDLSSLPKSITHGDVSPQNVLYTNGELVAFLDWEEVGVEVSVLDLAVCILGFCIEKNTLKNRNVQSLLQGYERVRPLTTQERNNLPMAVRYTAFALTLWKLLLCGYYHRRPLKKEFTDFYWQVGFDDAKLQVSTFF